MSFSFEETPDSRQESVDGSGSASYTLIYKAVGESDDLLVQNYAYTASPVSVYRPSGVLYRKSITKDPDGWQQYLVTVNYGKLDKKSTPTGTATFSFDTQGATINIKSAKEHIGTYPSGPDHDGAINVKDDGDVEGVDIIIPALKLSYSFSHPSGIVDESFARTIAGVTGRTNNSTFRGFAAGELLFLGASGSDGTEADAVVTYDFAASNNETGLSIGSITSIAKNGHDYAWIEFQDEVATGEAVRTPKRVHVERVYDSFNFASVFGWS